MTWMVDTHALIWHCIREKTTLLSKDRHLPFYREHGLDFVCDL